VTGHRARRYWGIRDIDVVPAYVGRMTTVTEDLKALTDGELFDRLSAAIRALPPFSDPDGEARQRAWDDMRRYHDELARRYGTK